MPTLSWLPDAAWRGALLLTSAFVAARLLRTQPAALRHVLWAGAIAGVMAMPLLSIFAPVRVPLDVPGSIARLAPATPDATTSNPDHLTSRATPMPTGDVAASAGRTTPVDEQAAMSPAASDDPRAARVTLAEAALAAWFTGATLVALHFLTGMLALRRMRRRSREVDDPAVLALVSSCATRIGTRTIPRLFVGPAVAMPCTAGWFRPVVLLPDESRTWSRERLEVVLLHELGHIHRMDIIPHLIAEMTRIVYWFNPLVWLATARLRAEAESATDERVVHAGARPSDYADHLLGIVLQARKAWHPAPLIPLARRTQLEGRILAILESRGRALPGARSISSVLALVATMSLGIASVGSAAVIASSRPDPVETIDDAAAVVAPSVNAPEPQARATERPTTQGTGGESTVGALAEALRDPVASVRQAAAQALASARDTVAVRALIEVLRSDESTLVRRSAAWSLGEIGDAAAIPALAEALARDRDPEVRRNAASALGSIDHARATPALTQALTRDTDVAVRVKAAEALGNIEDPASIDALIRALDNDDDAGVRRAVIDAIDNLDDERAAPSVTRALRDTNAEVRRAAAEALGSLEGGEGVPELIAVARDADAEVRRAVLQALSSRGDRRALPAFVAALSDRDAEVRRAATEGIGNLENVRNAPPELIRTMNDTDAEVRQGAAHALGHIKDPAAVRALVARVTDPDADVRQAVVHALEDFDEPEVAAALRTALKDASAEVRQAAAKALGNRTKSR